MRGPTRTDRASNRGRQRLGTCWGQSSIQKRSDTLDAIGNELIARKEELGELVAREEGKTLLEGIGETVRAAQIFKFFGAETLRLNGEFLTRRPGLDVTITRAPLVWWD